MIETIGVLLIGFGILWALGCWKAFGIAHPLLTGGETAALYGVGIAPLLIGVLMIFFD